MKKEKKIRTRIIFGIIALFLVISLAQPILPGQTLSANTKLNWDNPNKSGDNPYKINTDAILNSQTLMHVVGCTGIVDTVTTWTTDFLKKQTSKLLNKSYEKILTSEAKAKICELIKKPIILGTAWVTGADASEATEFTIQCGETSYTYDKRVFDQLILQSEKDEKVKKRQECFDGLAYTLAKNQLTSMTRQTVNWINTGFNGDPMYVRNITSLTNSIERGILEPAIEKLAYGAFPFGRDFSRTVVRSYNTGGMKYGADNFLDSLTSDLAYFITDKDSYLPGSEKETPLERSQRLNNTFANDFSAGGWDGWLALTQRDQNNPLGFTMQATQYLSDRIAQQSTELKDELYQNDGFMSQKKCVLWAPYGPDGKRLMVESAGPGSMKKYSDYSEDKDSEFDKCVKWENVTPGSIIKDKLTTYINSPERQLEMADTINKSLNSLFTNLIEKFRNEGLFGLSQERYTYLNDNMGVGYGSNMGYDGNFAYQSNDVGGGYQNDSFDLTRDLGNTYNRADRRSLGTWDAKNNIPRLIVGLGQYSDVGQGYHSPNYYYTVTVAGNTKLIEDGYNSWAVGDRAFWDGKSWQNWKTNQSNPIVKRGVIQIQKDYVVAAREILKTMPAIMPKLGELDYCIPGPNPYFRNNSSETEELFRDFAGTLMGTYKGGKFLKRDSTVFEIAGPGNDAYDFYREIFRNTAPTMWNTITKTLPFRSLSELGQGTAKRDSAEEKIEGEVAWIVNQVSVDIKQFYQDYTDNVFKKVYEPMTQEFLTREDTMTVTENPAYLPMASEGYSITKDIVKYDVEIKEAIEDYKTAILQAELNTAKLNTILKRVSEIVQDAQGRRNDRMVEILEEETEKMCEQEYNVCLSNPSSEQNCLQAKEICLDKIMTLEEYEEYYKDCLEEEDIHYYDPNELMHDLGGEEGARCFDGIDNDLDGLIDKDDPDCANAYNNPIGQCVNGTPFVNNQGFYTTACTERTSKQLCLETPYYRPNTGDGYICEWQQGGGGGSGIIEECFNGAINYPQCDIFDLGGEVCLNGAINFPVCNSFPSGGGGGSGGGSGGYEGQSLYGCFVANPNLPLPTNQPNNTHCLTRTENACTAEPFYYNNQRFNCAFDLEGIQQ